MLTLVTFVGGPLHGTQQTLDRPDQMFWHHTPQGGAVLYARRWQSLPNADATEVHLRAIYAPVGMSENAYEQQAATLAALLGEGS